jgi:hypothetical protein
MRPHCEAKLGHPDEIRIRRIGEAAQKLPQPPFRAYPRLMRGRVSALAGVLVAVACPAAHASSPEAKAFVRHHHGFKVVATVHSDFVPGWSAVWWLKPGGASGSYAAGGAAYYKHGRATRSPSGAAVSFLHPHAIYNVVSKGSAAFTKRDGQTQTDPENGDNVAYNNDDASWSWDFTYRHFAVGDVDQNVVKATPHGGGTGSVTSKSSADNGPTTCTYPIAFGQDESSLVVTRAKDGTLRFQEGLSGGQSGNTANCTAANFEDPNDPEGDHPLTISYRPGRPPAEFSAAFSYFEPFTAHGGFDHKRDRSHTDKDDPSFHIIDVEELREDHTLQFQLVGLSGHI